MKILTEPKNSLVKQYKKLFELDGVLLEIDKPALKAVAHKAIERKTGARGLRSILEETMVDIMFKIPSDETIQKCIVTEDCITEGKQPKIRHKKAS